MRTDRHQLLAGAAALGLALAAPGAARADTFAQSILIVNNFRLSHSSGALFAADGIDGRAPGRNDAHAVSALNGSKAGGYASAPLLAGAAPDVAHQLLGVAAPASAENHFLQFGAPPALPGSFAYADQYLGGHQAAGAEAGAQAMTRADAGLAAPGQADSHAGMRSVGTFAFALGAGDTLTVSFDATPFTEATLRDPLGPDAQAAARLAWRISIVDLTSGLDVFAFAPEQLNGQSAVGRGSAAPGTSRYDPGTLTFSATTPFLDPNRSYQMTIQHNALANAMQLAGGALPAPASLALLGLGLLALAMVRRRTR